MSLINFGKLGERTAEQQFKEVESLVRTFEASSDAKIACRVISEEVLRSKLVSESSKDPNPGEEGAPRKLRRIVSDSPMWAERFVKDAIRAAMISGYFAFEYRGGRVVVADPLDVALVESDRIGNPPKVLDLNRFHKAVLRKTRRNWIPVIFRMPSFATSDRIRAIKKSKFSIIRSPLADAAVQLDLLQAAQQRWMTRDEANSRHSGYCTISLENQRGSTRPWFAGSDSVAAQLNTSDDFEALVEDRASTIRRLDENTTMIRQQLDPELVMIGDEDESGAAGKKRHTEHIVTDGMNFSESRGLSSEARFSDYCSGLRRDALMLLGLPVQALGENVNTERMASSNALTEAAINIFKSGARRYKRVCESILKEVGVVFEKCMSIHDVERLEAVLKPNITAKMYACAYDIPPDWIDPTRLKQRSDLLNGLAKAQGAGKTAIGGAASEPKAGRALPETALQLLRRNDERTRTDSEPKGALEQKESDRKRKRKAEEAE